VHYVNVLTGPWLMRVHSPQPGGGLVQVFAALLIFPAAGSFGQHGRPWFAVPVAVAMAAVHVALLLPAEPLAELRPRRVTLTAGVLGIGLVAGLSVWLSESYGAAWSVGMLLAAGECGYVFGRVRLTMAAVAVLTVLAGFTIPQTAVGSAVIVLVAGAIAVLRRRLLTTIDELNVARTELADYAVIMERQRFSRDLHDLLGHSLSTIVVTAELAARSLRSDSAAAERAFTDIEAIGRTALSEVRSAVTGYRTMSFRDQLRAGREALRVAGIEVTVSTSERCWSDGVDQVLSWTVRESITNVLRHSHARHVLIALTVDSARLCLRISDDGDAGETGLLRAEGGLRTLRERLAADQGTLDVTLGPDGGLRLAVHLPLTKVKT
jgi:two-component system, NarL family, sensor histidine kinase DesK